MREITWVGDVRRLFELPDGLSPKSLLVLVAG